MSDCIHVNRYSGTYLHINEDPRARAAPATHFENLRLPAHSKTSRLQDVHQAICRELYPCIQTSPVCLDERQRVVRACANQSNNKGIRCAEKEEENPSAEGSSLPNDHLVGAGSINAR